MFYDSSADMHFFYRNKEKDDGIQVLDMKPTHRNVRNISFYLVVRTFYIVCVFYF